MTMRVPATRDRAPLARSEKDEANSSLRTWGMRQAPEATSGGRLRKLFGHDWITPAGLLLIDVGVWIAIYALAGRVRGDSFYVTPLQFFFIGSLQLTVIIASLFVIGGYDRQTEMRGLPYATEHIL